MSRSALVVAASTLLLVAGLAAPAVAQSPDPAAPVLPTGAAVVVTCDELVATPAMTAAVDAAARSALQVSLCSNPSTGFRWTDPVSSDPAIAAAGGWTFIAADADAPGAPGTEVLTLTTGAPGHAVVSLSYDQPWDGGQKGAWTVELDVVVREAVSLSIDCDAFVATPDAIASVDVPVGDVVLLDVCSNGATGFTWTPATTSDPAVAVPGTWVTWAPDDTGMAGAPGTAWLTITADSAGSAVITSSYDRPWEGGEKGVWTLALTINVL